MIYLLLQPSRATTLPKQHVSWIIVKDHNRTHLSAPLTCNGRLPSVMTCSTISEEWRACLDNPWIRPDSIILRIWLPRYGVASSKYASCMAFVCSWTSWTNQLQKGHSAGSAVWDALVFVDGWKDGFGIRSSSRSHTIVTMAYFEKTDSGSLQVTWNIQFPTSVVP